MQDYINGYVDRITSALRGLDGAAFSRIIEILAEAYGQDKQIFICGNGGSAGTANHFVCDFGKNAVLQPGKRRFRILSVCDNVEKMTALGNDITFEEIFRQQLINLMNEGDVLIAVSASGNSADLLRACEYAQSRQAKIIGLAGFSGGKLKEMSDVAMIVPLESYEQIEDLQLVILHMIVYYVKNHPELLGE